MLFWSVLFFIVALLAGIFGFGGIATASAGIAQFLFFLFLIGFVITTILHFARSVDHKTGL